MRVRKALIIGLMAAAAIAVPTTASATIYYVLATIGTTGHGLHTKVHLKLQLNGQIYLNQVVRSPACGPGCTTTSIGSSNAPVRVLQLVPNTAPEVVLGLYSGGAHCCFVDDVYTLDPYAHSVQRVEHNFLDAGAKIVDLSRNGRYEFQSADARFAEYGFSDYADSGAPIQIFSFSGNAFHEVTGHYRALVRADAAHWWHAFRHDHGNGRGLIAAWAGDEDRLGNFGQVRAALAKALHRGELRAPTGFTSSPQRFVTNLQRFLRRLGYAH